MQNNFLSGFHFLNYPCKNIHGLVLQSSLRLQRVAIAYRKIKTKKKEEKDYFQHIKLEKLTFDQKKKKMRVFRPLCSGALNAAHSSREGSWLARRLTKKKQKIASRCLKRFESKRETQAFVFPPLLAHARSCSISLTRGVKLIQIFDPFHVICSSLSLCVHSHVYHSLPFPLAIT